MRRSECTGAKNKIGVHEKKYRFYAEILEENDPSRYSKNNKNDETGVSPMGIK
jgi:hypothetical protein